MYVCMYVKTKYEILLQNVLDLLHFGSSENCMSSGNLFSEI